MYFSFALLPWPTTSPACNVRASKGLPASPPNEGKNTKHFPFLGRTRRGPRSRKAVAPPASALISVRYTYHTRATNNGTRTLILLIIKQYDAVETTSSVTNGWNTARIAVTNPETKQVRNFFTHQNSGSSLAAFARSSLTGRKRVQMPVEPLSRAVSYRLRFLPLAVVFHS